MRHALHAQATFAAVIACALGSAAGVAFGADEAAAPGLAPVTAAAIERMQPFLDSPGEGRRLFLKLNCYGCHGAFAGGGIGPSIVGAPRGEVEFNVMNGNEGGMPAFAQYVDETDITNIANYLESIGTGKEPVFFDWWKQHPKK